MDRRKSVVGWLLSGVLTLAPCLVDAAPPPDSRPLRLGLATLPASFARSNATGEFYRAPIRHSATAASPPGKPVQPLPNLRQRALQSVLSSSDAGMDEANGDPTQADRFHFEHRGPAWRNLARTYKSLCATASAKIWDEPDGKRIRFDVAGKPGVGVEVPIR
ncbi:MAG: hypothetical protein ABIW30_08325 [Arenimonas sp.]